MIIGAFLYGDKMAQIWAKSFYNSKDWIRCRKSYIEHRNMVDGGMCEECRSRVGYIVHHKITLTEDNINNPDIALNFDKLMYVCKECHDLYEGHGVGTDRKEKPLCTFDENGQPISLREIDRIPP